MRKLLALLMVVGAAGCGPDEYVVPANDVDVPQAEHSPSMAKAEEDAEKKIALMTVNEAVQGYRLLSKEKRYPQNLDQLVEGGMLPSLPDLPEGFSYAYDAETGQVTIAGEPEKSDETEG